MATKRKKIKTVTIAGGGDSGLLTALLLQRFNPRLSITVVDDFTEEIPQIGKSTYDALTHILHNSLGIEEERFISEVKPVWKASVYFKDWCGRDPFHIQFDDGKLPLARRTTPRFEELYHRYETRDYKTVNTELVKHQKTPFKTLDADARYGPIAYHLSTNRFNEFLRNLCLEREIQLVNDTITGVHLEEDRITRVTGESADYEADLYIDATGFSRVLMKNMNTSFNQFDFPLDSAIVAQVPIELSGIVPATVITTGEHGWFWQIDTVDCRDIGYVHSSKHTSTNEAVAEFISKHDGQISESDINRYQFNSGVYEKPWINNCVAVGNALGFVEPLQSTALTVNSLIAKKLSELLARQCRYHYPGIREVFNTFARRNWSRVYEFISIHYKYSQGTSQFWNDVRSVNENQVLDEYTSYQEHGFALHDELYDHVDGPDGIFPHWIFYRVLQGVGVRSNFYEGIDVNVQPDVRKAVSEYSKEVTRYAEECLSYKELYTHLDAL